MTVSVEDTKEVLVGDGETVTWPFDFKVDSAADLTVFTTSYEGVDSPLLYGDDFTVVLNANQNTNPGGSITTANPIQQGIPFVIARGMNFSRLTSFTTSVPPHIIEAELDRLTMYCQQLKEKLDRALHVSAATQVPVDLNYRNAHTRHLKIVGFDDDGRAALLTLNGTAVAGPQGPSRVSRVEVSRPAIFRRSANGSWSHTSTLVTFIWSANGVQEQTRGITITIDPGTGTFNVPTPVTGITVEIDVSSQLMKLTSTFGNVQDYIELAIIRMSEPLFDSDTFTPSWAGGQWSGGAPSGLVSYTNYYGVVSLSLANAQVGTSADTAMTWAAGSLPASIRPASPRAVSCKLKYNDTLVTYGVMTIGSDGSAAFQPFQLGAGVVQPGAFQIGQSKGLPADWTVVYSL